MQRRLTPRRQGHLEVPAPAADQGRLPPYRRVPAVARVNLVAGVHLLPPPRRHYIVLQPKKLGYTQLILVTTDPAVHVALTRFFFILILFNLIF